MKSRTPGPWFRKDRLENDETTAEDAAISWSPPGERGSRPSFIHDRHQEAHAREVPRGSCSSEVEDLGGLVNKAMNPMSAAAARSRLRLKRIDGERKS